MWFLYHDADTTIVQKDRLDFSQIMHVIISHKPICLLGVMATRYRFCSAEEVENLRLIFRNRFLTFLTIQNRNHHSISSGCLFMPDGVIDLMSARDFADQFVARKRIETHFQTSTFRLFLQFNWNRNHCSTSCGIFIFRILNAKSSFQSQILYNQDCAWCSRRNASLPCAGAQSNWGCFYTETEWKKAKMMFEIRSHTRHNMEPNYFFQKRNIKPRSLWQLKHHTFAKQAKLE